MSVALRLVGIWTVLAPAVTATQILIIIVLRELG